MSKFFILLFIVFITKAEIAYAQNKDSSNVQVDFYPRLSQMYLEGGHIKNTTNSTNASTYNVSTANSNSQLVGVTVDLSRKWSVGLSVSAIQSSMSGTFTNNQAVTGNPKQTSFSGILNYNFYPFLSAGAFYGSGQGPNSLIYGLTSYPSNSNSQLAGVYGSFSLLLNQWIVGISPSYVYSSSTTNANAVSSDPDQYPSSNVSSYLNTANLALSLSYITQGGNWRFDSGFVTHQVLRQNVPNFQIQYANIWYTPFLGVNYLTSNRYQLYIRGTKELGYSQMGGNSITFGVSKFF